MEGYYCWSPSQTQLIQMSGPMSSDSSDAVLRFWLELVLGCPNWHKEKSMLLLLDTLCMAAFSKPAWTEVMQETLLEAYQVREWRKERWCEEDHY